MKKPTPTQRELDVAIADLEKSLNCFKLDGKKYRSRAIETIIGEIYEAYTAEDFSAADYLVKVCALMIEREKVLFRDPQKWMQIHPKETVE